MTSLSGINDDNYNVDNDNYDNVDNDNYDDDNYDNDDDQLNEIDSDRPAQYSLLTSRSPPHEELIRLNALNNDRIDGEKLKVDGDGKFFPAGFQQLKLRLPEKIRTTFFKNRFH